MANKSYFEKQNASETKRKTAQAERAKVKKKMKTETQSFVNYVRALVKDCGLTNSEVANCAGLDHSTVMGFISGKKGAVRLETIVALLKAAGHRLKIEPVEPENDDCRQLRRYPPTPIEKK